MEDYNCAERGRQTFNDFAEVSSPPKLRIKGGSFRSLGGYPAILVFSNKFPSDM